MSTQPIAPARVTHGSWSSIVNPNGRGINWYREKSVHAGNVSKWSPYKKLVWMSSAHGTRLAPVTGR